MRLVFVHGWGFDKKFWNSLIGNLPNFDHVEVELGFLGAPPIVPAFQPGDVLIGHSLGFAWGMSQIHDFPRWISINSFARFVGEGNSYCVPPANLRAMRRNLEKNPQQVLQDFHSIIESPDTPDTFSAENLSQGLVQLESFDLNERLFRENTEGLILAATDDMLVPVAASEYMASQCRSVDVLWHKNGGHLLPLNEPLWCATEIKKFLGHA